MTEFGADANNEKSAQEIDHILEMADKRAISWNYWEYKLFEDHPNVEHPSP